MMFPRRFSNLVTSTARLKPRRSLLCILLLMFMLATGCAPQFRVRATDYHMSLHINPENNNLIARTVITLRPIDDTPSTDGPVWIGLDLNASLCVSDIRVEGAELRSTRVRRSRKSNKNDHPPTPHNTHILVLDRPTDELTVTVDYYGPLLQDIAAGEKPGEIHNFTVSAHISPEGTYLTPSGYWYPTPNLDDDDLDPALYLADWRIEADHIEDYELLAGAHRTGGASDRYSWVSPHKLTSMTLTGGKHDVWSDRRGDVDIRVHMKHTDDPTDRAANEAIAKRYIDETARYIERYEPLLGPFPYDQYTIVENFFSSGFAFPTMTLFGPAVMHMGDNSFRHGYLDHELVHSWWGCGVDVDTRDGNWCEGLTSYCTNYYGFVLDQDEKGARKKRRDQSNFLSRLKPEDDKPLGTFGLEDGAGRGIAYSKAAAVFHMLSRQIGQENFWQACRTFSERFMGTHADWNDLKTCFEEASDSNLDVFFDQWVRRGGAPMLTLGRADFDTASGTLTVEIDQGETPFAVDLPLRVYYGDPSSAATEGAYEDVVVTLRHARDTIEIALQKTPRWVELDPDYHVFRKLKRSEIMPTTATTKSTESLTIIFPPGERLDAYVKVADDFQKLVQKKDTGSLVTGDASGSIPPEYLASRGVLILGDAVRHPVIRDLLARTNCPIEWHEQGFSVDGQAFTSPEYAVLATMHHPDTPDDGITVYVGNSEQALGNAAILGFYANSLLVFETGERTEVVLRRDFESHQRIKVSVR